MWKRWSTEYLRTLPEKHNLKHHGKPSTLSVDEVVIITSDERNRGKWTLGIVEELFPGKMVYHPRYKGKNGKWTLGESSQSRISSGIIVRSEFKPANP